MKINDLASGIDDLLRFSAQPEMNPFTEPDALQEAQLLGVQLDSINSGCLVLFELRTALQLREGNTGVLVAEGVRSLQWDVGVNRPGRTAWTVLESTPTPGSAELRLSLGLWPKASFELVAQRVGFLVIDVLGLPVAPPSYVDSDDATIRAGLPGWNSEFLPIHAVFDDHRG